MKKTCITLLTFLFLALCTVLEAQKKSDIVIKNTCDCINRTEFTDYDYNSLVEKLGLCMASDLIGYYDELREELDITEEDYSEAMSQIGEKLGERLALECPKFMELSMKMLQENDDIKEKVMNEIRNEESEKKQTFTGKVEKVKLEALSGIVVNSGDESLYFIWLEKFGGSSEFEKNPESLKGKKVTITYYETEIYDGPNKTYVKKRVISKIEIN